MEVGFFFFKNPNHLSFSAVFFLANIVYGFSINGTIVSKYQAFINRDSLADSAKEKLEGRFFTFVFFLQVIKYTLVTCFFFVIVSSYQELFLAAFFGFVYGLFSGSLILIKLKREINTLFGR